MKTAFSKLLALLLTFVMLLDAMPMAVFAEDVQSPAAAESKKEAISAETKSDAGAEKDASSAPVGKSVSDPHQFGNFGSIPPEQEHALAADEYKAEPVSMSNDLRLLIEGQPEKSEEKPPEEQPMRRGVKSRLMTTMAEPALRGAKSEPDEAAVNEAAVNEAAVNEAVVKTGQHTGYLAYEIDKTDSAPAAFSYAVSLELEEPVDILADANVKNVTVETVAYTLYHIHTEKDGSQTVSEIVPNVNWQDRTIYGFSFTTDDFSTFVLKYTVDFSYNPVKAEISIDLEKLQKAGNEFGQLIQKNAQGLEEIEVSGILDFAQAYLSSEHIDSEVYTLYLSNGTALADFDADFFADAAVTIEGKGAEYGNGKITLTGNVENATVTFSTEKATLALTLTNYTAPEKPVVPDTEDGFSYRFYQETAAMADILKNVGIVSSYNSVSVSDTNLITVDEENDTLTVQNYFGEVVLTVALSDGTEVEIKLQNPAPVKAGETVVVEGVGSFAAAEEVPDGTKLVVNANPEVPEGITIGGAKKRGGPVESDPVFFEVSLVGPQGEKLETGADVTLHTDIKLPEAPEGQSVKVTGVKVYHIGGKGEAEELDKVSFALGEGTISSVSFATPGFSLFAVTYTVELIEINFNGVINLNFNDFEPYPAEGADAAFVYDTDTCDIRVSVESVLNAALSAEAAGDGVVSEKPEIENFEIDLANLTVTSAEGGVIFIAATDEAEGMLIITADGSVELTDGEKTLTINISGITKLSEEILKAEGVEIQVEKGNIPLGSEAQYTAHTDEETARIVDEYKLTIIEGEGNGFSSADLKIVRNEEEVNAEGQFKVTIEKSNLIPEGMKLEKLYHIHDGKAEEVTVTENEEGKLEFEVANFSDFVASYTVDFEYSVNGKMYQFSLLGGEKIVLSDLIEVLGIIGDTSFKNVKAFLKEIDTVTFSDEDLLAVTKVTEETTFADIDAQVFDVFAAGGEEPEEDTAIVSAPDWVLTSLAPFSTEETLTISMKNGDEITIDVTDDQEPNLAEFITDASLEIEGKTYGQGQTWNVREGVDYALKLTFRESGSRQFPQGGEEIIMNPEDLGGMSLEPGQSGTFDIPLGLYGTVTGNTWWVDNEGKMHVKFGLDPDDLLTRSNNVYFNLEMNVKFSGTGDTVEFNDRVEREWTVNTDTDIKVNKNGYYDSATGKMVYTITVTSTGKSTNVKVTDSFVNTDLLTLDQESITISPNKELAETGNSTSSSGFTRVIKEIGHNETVTITYTADVNEAALEPGGKVTGDDGKNNVKVETDQEKEDEKTHIVNEIKWSDLSKVSTSSEEISDDKIKLSWEIDANTSRTASLVGSTISDRIDWNSKEYMKYVQSDGKVTLHVVGTAADGTTYTKDIQVPVGNNQNQESWSWVVENLGETEGTPLSYKITYDTVAIKQTDNSSVKNDANNSAGGSDSGVGVIPGTNPGGGDEPKINTRKEATEVTADYIDWKIVINVPEEGFPDGLKVTDYIPRYNGIHDGGYGFADRLIGAPEISGHDYYEWSVSDDDSHYYHRDGVPFATQTLTIEFYKDANKQNKGVDTGAKTITIRLRTANDQIWVDYAAAQGGGDTSYFHYNTGYVNETDISAYGIPLKPEIEKSMIQEYSEDGLPYYTYQVDLSNVTELPVVITDTFDTDYLEFNKIGDDRWYARDYIAAAEQKNLLNAGIAPYAATAETTEDGIIITANDLPKKDNGHFYEYYRIYYSLKVKDADALAALKAQAIAKGGKYTLHNTAIWDGLPDEFDVDYEVTAVNKEGYFASNNPEERKFTFVIDANPNRFKLGSNGTVELTDQHTVNLSVDYSSVKIYEIPVGVTVSDAKTAVQNNQMTGWQLQTGGVVSWNFIGNEGTFYLNDETHYVIVYDAIVIGSGNQKFSNVADLNGFISSKEGEKTYSSATSAGGEVWEIKLLKYKDGLTSHGLQGATFQLFRGTGEYVQVSGGWYEEIKEPMKYGDTPTTRANGKVGANITFTTGSDGTVNIQVDQVHDGNGLEGGVHYYLKEIDSPSGYQIDSSTEYWAFTLTNDPDEVNYGDPNRRDEYGNRQWVYYYYNDILKMANTETHNPLDVVVNKTWYDEDGNEITGQNLDPTYVATVQLLRKTDDEDYVPVKVEYGTDGKPSSITEVSVSTSDSWIQLTYENNWSYTWSQLPRVEMGGDKGLEVIHRYAYKIEEVSVDGYVVSMTESETERVKTYALKNYATPDEKTTEITVNKNWRDSNGTAIDGTAAKLPAEIQFKLYRAVSTTPFTRVPSTGGSLYVIANDNRLVNQEAAEGADDYGVYKLTKADSWQTTFADLPETETDGGTTYYYAYYVKEIPMSGYTTTYTSNGTTRTITNREPLPEGKYINIGLEKKWTDGTNTTPPSGASATFTVHQQKSTKSESTGTISVKYDDLEYLKANPGDEITLSLSGSAYGGTSLSTNGTIVSYHVGLDLNGSGSYQYEIPSNFEGTELVFSLGSESVEITSITRASGESVSYSEFVDTSWTKTITLPTTAGAWSTTVKDLIQEDADGNLYQYYITEDSCTPEASSIEFKDDIGNRIYLNTSGQKVEVTNVYTRDTGSLNITKTTTLNGAADSTGTLSGTYSFTVADKEDSTKVAMVNITVENGVAIAAAFDNTPTITGATIAFASGTATLGNLPAGTYTVTENLTAEQSASGIKLASVTLDGTAATNGVEVTVQPNNSANIPTAAFVNNKDTVNLKLQKTVVNNTATNTSDQEFSFAVTLTAPSGVTFDASYPTVATSATNVETTDSTQAVTSGTAFTVSLKGGESWQINNLPKGTSYSIAEGALPVGWTLTSTPNPKTGTMNMAGATETVQFQNTYSETTATPQGKKTLVGRDWNGDTFNFTLTPTGDTLTAIGNGTVKMPAGAAATSPYAIAGTAAKASGSGSQTFNFGAITFLEAGTYTFSMTETAGNDTSLTYATNIVTVTVTVPAKTDGAFATEPTVAYSNTNTDTGVADNEFVNTYDTSTTAQIKGTKAVTNGTVLSGYEFTLTDGAGNAITGISNATSNASGQFEFAAITYTMAQVKTDGTHSGSTYTAAYTYKVKEVVPDPAVTDAETALGYAIRSNIKYVLAPVNVTVTVVYDESDGSMSATVIPAQAELLFTNEQLGSLNVTKEILHNGTLDTSATGGPFYYAVYDAEYNASADHAMVPVATGSITVTTGGTASATVSNLSYGTYYVYELTEDGGTPIVSGQNGTSETVAGVLYLVKGSGSTATVGATAGTATLQNDVRTTQITVTKQWNTPENAPAATAVEFTLYEADGTTKVTKNAYGADLTNPVKITGTPDWSVAFSELPADGTYVIKETAVWFGETKETDVSKYFTVDETGTAALDATADSGIIINTPTTTTVEVTKAWSPAAPTDGTTIVLGLYNATDLDTVISSITLNGVPDAETSGENEEEFTIAGNAADRYEDSAWHAIWSNLPKYVNDTEITYVVKEITGASGYTVSYNNDAYEYALNNGTITNTLNETSLKIVKEDGTTHTHLTGAQFRLEKQNAGGSYETVAAYATITVSSVEGVILTGLTDGSYQLVETQAPAGYNMLSGAITFTISNGVVNQPTGDTVTYTAAVADDPTTTDVNEASPATFTIPNTPGVELPSTGGSGTILYTLSGLILLLGAALTLYYRRKREQN